VATCVAAAQRTAAADERGMSEIFRLGWCRGPLRALREIRCFVVKRKFRRELPLLSRLGEKSTNSFSLSLRGAERRSNPSEMTAGLPQSPSLLRNDKGGEVDFAQSVPERAKLMCHAMFAEDWKWERVFDPLSRC
jgi:hypothetical protein